MTMQVSGWDEYFESAKSKTYKHKSNCYMPNKHGLGYRRLVAHKNGPAMFGAWCSLVQVLSRQTMPRYGYLTDTGKKDGRPLSASDISMLIDMPQILVEEMLQVTASQEVEWLKDTTGIPQEIIKNGSSLSDGEGEGDGKGKGEGKGEGGLGETKPDDYGPYTAAVKDIIACRPEFARLRGSDLALILQGAKANPRYAENLQEYLMDAANSREPPRNPTGMLRAFMASEGSNKRGGGQKPRIVCTM